VQKLHSGYVIQILTVFYTSQTLQNSQYGRPNVQQPWECSGMTLKLVTWNVILVLLLISLSSTRILITHRDNWQPTHKR